MTLVGAALQNRYRIDANLGQGGMGVVYRARDTLLDRDVAVKVLSDANLSAEGRARLLREAQAAARLSHPNVVGVFDAGEADDVFFIVMELVDGKTLYSRLPLPLDMCLAVARQLCAALGHAHAHGIIHRDLKPENVIITPDNTAKLMDFGLAWSAAASRLTAEGAILGTVFYLSPEQALGEAVDGRADLYALGVMLYEMVTGRLPFDDRDPLVVITQHLHTTPKPLREICPELPPTLEAIILKLLAKKPADRFASASEVEAALAGMVSNAILAPAVSRPHNLPASLTSFVGREKEITGVKQLLGGKNLSGLSRLVTLTGPGGVGKTRLALQVAGELLDGFAHGVFFVNLTPIHNPELVASAISQVLGIKESASQSAVETLKDELRDKQMLLVLDNFEQVLAAAPLAAELLTVAPGLKILATSREILHLSGEHEFVVPPLRENASSQLFAARARAAKSGFSLGETTAPVVAEICQHLDGLPLAIELAAAQCKFWSLARLRERLERRLPQLTGGPRDQPARQQTLRNTLDWSYDLLNEAERCLFARLGVFVGGWTLEAAEQVAGDEKSSPKDASSLLPSLVDKSLVQSNEINGEPRFTMLETIREYALEKLAANGEADAARGRHLAYYTSLVETAEDRVYAGLETGESWLNRIAAEHDNVRAALAWAFDGHDADCGARLAGVTAMFWYTHGHLNEGRRWLERALNLTPGHGQIRAKALNGAGVLAWQQGDYAVARERLEESVALWREIGPAGGRGLPVAVHILGHVRFDQRDYAEARELFAESLALNRARGEKQEIMALIGDLGLVASHLGDYAEARARFEESLAHAREQGLKNGIAVDLIRLGDLARFEGDDERAAPMYEESLALCREIGDVLDTASALHKLGHIACHRGDYRRAQALFAESLTLQHEQGNKQGIVEALAGFAGLAAAVKQPERAARLFGAAEALLDAIGAPLAPADRAEWERDAATARAQLDKAAFEAAWAEGRTMTRERAIAYALATDG
jgi:predicted ATPase/Tfp pilus assembly protein PilF